MLVLTWSHPIEGVKSLMVSASKAVRENKYQIAGGWELVSCEAWH